MKRTILAGLLVLATSASGLSFAPGMARVASAHEPDTIVKSADGTVYFITKDTDGHYQRMPFTSAGAFESYGFLSFNNAQSMDAADISYPIAGFIPPRDGTIFCATETKGTDVKGECSLITGGQKAAFTSAEAFLGQGYSFAKAKYGDSSFLPKTNNISDASARHSSGVLINKDGTFFVVGDWGLAGIPSPDVLSTWGYQFSDAVPANGADRGVPTGANLMARQSGEYSVMDSINSDSSQMQNFAMYLNGISDVPTNVVTSAEDVQAVNNFLNQIDPLTFTQLIPYMTAESQDALKKYPALQSMFENYEGDDYLGVMQPISSNIVIYGNKDFAILSMTDRENSVNFERTSKVVFHKENGAWKFDLLRMLKKIDQDRRMLNPTNSDVATSGKKDIAVTYASFTDTHLGSQQNRAVVKVRNNGQAPIFEFAVIIDDPSSDDLLFVDYSMKYTLMPGQEILLMLPLDTPIRGSVGSRNFTAVVAFPESTDEEISNNTLDFTASIQN